MQTLEQRSRYQSLELIAPTPSLKARLAAVLSGIKNAIFSLVDTNQEPRIIAIRDRSGQLQWRVYDPVSGYTGTFASEDAVRVWLDQRYA
ncbi:MAG: hypothetical protein AAF289_14555 [Cyanobacteria bacterium P01_A01_bin.135]